MSFDEFQMQVPPVSGTPLLWQVRPYWQMGALAMLPPQGPPGPLTVWPGRAQVPPLSGLLETHTRPGSQVGGFTTLPPQGPPTGLPLPPELELDDVEELDEVDELDELAPPAPELLLLLLEDDAPLLEELLDAPPPAPEVELELEVLVVVAPELELDVVCAPPWPP